MTELEHAYEALNAAEDLLGDALCHLMGDPGYENKAAIIGMLQSYFDAKRRVGQSTKDT